MNVISAVPSARFIRELSDTNGHSCCGEAGRSNVHSRSTFFAPAYLSGHGCSASSSPIDSARGAASLGTAMREQDSNVTASE